MGKKYLDYVGSVPCVKFTKSQTLVHVQTPINHFGELEGGVEDSIITVGNGLNLLLNGFFVDQSTKFLLNTDLFLFSTTPKKNKQTNTT